MKCFEMPNALYTNRCMPCKKRYHKIKQIGLIILTLILIYSCNNKSPKKDNSHTMISISDKSSKDSLTFIILQPDTFEAVSDYGLSEVFAKAVESFPNDSASLYRFYFKWNSTKDPEKIYQQKKRLEKLTSKKSVERYRSIQNNLKPLMTEIVNSNTLSKSQSDSLVKLYSDYDYFSGESLFSQLLTNDENYNLVWKSFKIMVQESSRDTCFISGLIKLDRNIRTNVELAEAIQDYKVQAIRNNPLGFLEMYGHRQGKQKINFANNITIGDDVDKELIDKFSEISENSTNKSYRQLATELIEQFKN